MKIYTKIGDKGETGLIGGKRISKDNPRIIAYGSVDELSSHIGLVISLLDLKDKCIFSDIIYVLTQIQSDLFIVGSDLAAPNYIPENKEEQQPNIPRVQENMISYIEFEIDKIEMQLNPITYFIMPGGGIEASSLHISRSIARRAEIAVTTLSKSETINPAILAYLNRLSDLLFVCARLVNRRLGAEDIAWKAPSKNS
jgi:cob(I)alamin adenosyltransferase